MKFFKHYKNKPYTYVGVARHSETLEEVVIYETRYENTGGKVWVRPKGMFFENVQVDGQTVPRFKQIPLEMKETTQVTETEIKVIAALMDSVFGQWDPKWFFSTFDNRKKFYLITAFVEAQPVAFKLGYELNDREFYSWLGGVLPEYRGLGIASDLMKHQHEWCRSHAYGKIQTKTQNRFRDMFVLNLQHGFDVIGTHESDEGGLKIVLEKNLK